MKIAKLIGKHKALEGAVEWDRDSTHILDIGINWTRRCDHAGIELRFSIWRFHSYLFFYDANHFVDRSASSSVDESDGRQACAECGDSIGPGYSYDTATGNYYCDVWCALGEKKS